MILRHVSTLRLNEPKFPIVHNLVEKLDGRQSLSTPDKNKKCIPNTISPYTLAFSFRSFIRRLGALPMRYRSVIQECAVIKFNRQSVCVCAHCIHMLNFNLQLAIQRFNERPLFYLEHTVLDDVISKILWLPSIRTNTLIQFHVCHSITFF